MSADNKAIVRRLYEEVWNKRRLELVDEIISQATLSTIPTLPIPRLVLTLINAKFRASSPAFLICTSRLKISLAKRKSWPWLGLISGTHTGEFMGHSRHKQGKCTWKEITINHIVDGKIMDSYISWTLSA